MSLMAGYDIVLEFSKATIEKMLKNTISLNGTPLYPPFELSLPFTVAGQTGTVHFMVMDGNSIHLADLSADERAVFDIGFTNTSVIVGSLVAQALVGTLEISVKLRITSPTETPPNTLVADFSDVSVTTSLIPLSEAALQNALTEAQLPTPPSVAQLYELANTTIQQLLNKNLLVTLKPFTIDPGQIGDISGSPNIPNGARYMSMVNHNIRDPATGEQALGLFGVLIPANFILKTGNVALKTTTAIAAGEDFAVSLSGQSFHQFIFCPAAMTKLNASSQMPGTCGVGAGVESHGATITRLADSLDTGHINVDGTVYKSGFCYTASSPFHIEITLPVVNNQLSPQTSPPQTDPTVDIDWYCAVAAAVVGGYLAGVVGAIAADATVQVVGQIALAFRGITVPNVSVPPVGLPKFADKMTLDSALVSKEGLTLLGTLDIPPAFSGAIPQIGITVTVTNPEGQELVDNGTYHYKCTNAITCQDCPSHDFDYQQFAQYQAVTLQASATLLGTPVKWEWSLQDTLKTFPLASPRGSAALKVLANYPEPLPGGTNVLETALVLYTNVNDTVTWVRMLEGNGNWVVGVNLRGTDPLGTSLQTFAYVQIQHLVIVFGQDYDAYMKGCALNRYGRMIRILTSPQPVPPEGNWNPENIDTLVQDVAILGSVTQEEVLAQAAMRFGPIVLARFSTGIYGQVSTATSK